MRVLLNSAQFNEFLIKAGYTKRAFAHLSGISESSVHQLSSGKRNPSPTVAKKICDALGKEFDDLFEIVEK